MGRSGIVCAPLQPLEITLWKGCAESKTEDKGKARMGSYPDVTEDGIKKKDNRVK